MRKRPPSKRTPAPSNAGSSASGPVSWKAHERAFFIWAIFGAGGPMKTILTIITVAALLAFGGPALADAKTEHDRAQLQRDKEKLRADKRKARADKRKLKADRRAAQERERAKQQAATQK